MRKPKARIYLRGPRWWGDFRDFADVGGSREPLVPPGAKTATTDRLLAEKLSMERYRSLEAARRGESVAPAGRAVSAAHRLDAVALRHLQRKAESGKFNPRYLVNCERVLRRACEFFGPGTSVGAITPERVEAWLTSLRGRGLSNQTLRHHINALSNLYRTANHLRLVQPGYNPVAQLDPTMKPEGHNAEPYWLEVHEAALLLEAARTYRAARPRLAVLFAYELLAAFLFTGGRKSEVLGLEVEDVSFDRGTVTFRPNAWRRLKTRESHRVVPLWPQLEEILRPYVFGASRPPSRLLFPSFRSRRGSTKVEEHLLDEPRKLLDAIALRAGWKPGEIRTKMFRHTYCAARLQTLDRGAPVSVFTVQRELGHTSDRLVARVYGHLGAVRHRSDVVEYRADQHRTIIGERLAALVS
jgi:integrase